MYSRVYPHRASLKSMPVHGGNRTYDLWNTSPMLCQLSYAVRSVRVCDISEQNLVPLISMQSCIIMIFFCVGVMYSGEYDACDVTLSVYPVYCVPMASFSRGYSRFLYQG